MFKYLLISIVLVPILMGVMAANIGPGARGLQVLRASWAVYGILWLAMLYYLKYRWVA